MKRILLYILRTYLISVVAITMAVYVEAVVIQHYSPPEEETIFSSPAFAGIVCGVIYPILNLPVFMVLYKYRFTVIETITESVVFVKIIYLLDEIIRYILPSSSVWVHKTVDGLEIWGWEDAWWYGYWKIIVYSICLMIMLCFLYMRIKRMIHGYDIVPGGYKKCKKEKMKSR